MLGAILAAILGAVIFAALINKKPPVRWGGDRPGGRDALHAVHAVLLPALLRAALRRLTMDNFTVGIVALSIYHASYMAELLRGAWKELPKDTIDAGTAFGFLRLRAAAHHPAAGRHHGGADAGEPVHPDHQGQRVPCHYRRCRNSPFRPMPFSRSTMCRLQASCAPCCAIGCCGLVVEGGVGAFTRMTAGAAVGYGKKASYFFEKK